MPVLFSSLKKTKTIEQMKHAQIHIYICTYIYIYMYIYIYTYVVFFVICPLLLSLYNIAIPIIICRFEYRLLLKYANPCRNWIFQRFARAA